MILLKVCFNRQNATDRIYKMKGQVVEYFSCPSIPLYHTTTQFLLLAVVVHSLNSIIANFCI